MEIEELKYTCLIWYDGIVSMYYLTMLSVNASFRFWEILVSPHAPSSHEGVLVIVHATILTSDVVNN